MILRYFGEPEELDLHALKRLGLLTKLCSGDEEGLVVNLETIVNLLLGSTDLTGIGLGLRESSGDGGEGSQLSSRSW